MSRKNPYLLSAAQIRRWAATHNEEAWLLLLRMLEGQNTFFMRKRGEETAQVIQQLEEQLAKVGIQQARATQLRAVLADIRGAAGNVDSEHKKLERTLSGLSGSAKQLEKKLQKLRTLQAAVQDVDSRMVRDRQRARDTAGQRELKARRRVGGP
jgi:phage shock protein A